MAHDQIADPGPSLQDARRHTQAALTATRICRWLRGNRMNWYYVEAQQQVGPVDDEQLKALAASGKILNDTLVWHEGMENWQMYGEVAAPGGGPILAPPVVPPLAPAVPAGHAVCLECGGTFPQQDMIPHGGRFVCAGCKPVFMQKLAEGARINTGGLPYAGFWIRVGAKMLDGLILGIVFLPLLFFFSYKGDSEPGFGTYHILQLVVQLFYMAGNIGYQVFFLGKYGATPGKMACSLRVVTGEGTKIGYGRATGRVFAEMLSGMICYIGYIMVAFDDQKRGLHDYICNTRVIHK